MKLRDNLEREKAETAKKIETIQATLGSNIRNLNNQLNKTEDDKRQKESVIVNQLRELDGLTSINKELDNNNQALKQTNDDLVKGFNDFKNKSNNERNKILSNITEVNGENNELNSLINDKVNENNNLKDTNNYLNNKINNVKEQHRDLKSS